MSEFNDYLKTNKVRAMEFLAGRLACKEAYLKAVGVGSYEGVPLPDLSIYKDENEIPDLDGFELAEMDLKVRGPGDYFSVRQSGIPDFVFADFAKDLELFKIINKDAATLFEVAQNDVEVRRYIEKIISEIEISNQLN